MMVISLCTALLAEIKEINEKKRKEDDVLLAIAAGNRRPLLPNMEFEYPDSEIHEDLYQIIKYSCGEVCTSSDQLEKVMKVWTTFLEPILGVPPRHHGVEDTEDKTKPKSHSSKTGVSNGGVADKKSNGDESRVVSGDAAAVENGFHNVDRVGSRGDNAGNSGPHSRVHGITPTCDEMSGITMQTATIERVMDNNVSPAGRAEQSHKRTNLESTSGMDELFLFQF